MGQAEVSLALLKRARPSRALARVQVAKGDPEARKAAALAVQMRSLRRSRAGAGALIGLAIFPLLTTPSKGGQEDKGPFREINSRRSPLVVGLDASISAKALMAALVMRVTPPISKTVGAP